MECEKENNLRSKDHLFNVHRRIIDSIHPI